MLSMRSILFHVLPWFASLLGEPVQALPSKDGVALVPHRESKAQPLLVVADSPQPVLAPPVGPERAWSWRNSPGVAVPRSLADRCPTAFR